MPKANGPTALAKLKDIRDWLNQSCFEREDEIEGILVAMLSKESALFLGDAGSSKTQMARLAAQAMGVSFFDTLISPTTKPETIFGPIDVPRLARGQQVYKTEGYAPSCEILFFDEIFKAGGVVLNPLLWLLNEHQFRNGDLGIQQCPTMAVFGASNELPTDASLRPVLDRFLLRFKVQYIKDDKNLHRLMRRSARKSFVRMPEPMTRDELVLLQKAVSRVKVSSDVRQLVLKIRQMVSRATGAKISDRRLYKAIRILQAVALLKGRAFVRKKDTEMLSHLFWDDPVHQNKTKMIVIAATEADAADVVAYEDAAEAAYQGAIASGEIEEGIKKLEAVLENLKQYSNSASKRIRRSIAERHSELNKILNQRAEFHVLVTWLNSKEQIYRVGIATQMLWTPTQLRSVGFHWKKKQQMWWMLIQGKSVVAKRKFHAKLIRAIETTLKVKPTFKFLDKTGAL